jgi:hypothetical protein
LAAVIGRIVLYLSVAMALGIVAISACAPQQAGSPSPAPATATAARAASPSATARPTAAASATPTARPTVSAPASPGSSPASACPRVTGGAAGNQAQLVAIRIAHNPGFDRLVFELGPSTAPGTPGIPPYTIETASSLAGASGQPVTVAGSALFGIRFQNASTRSPEGTATYTGAMDLRPTTPLLREVRMVEDFERVMTWGAGLDHLACPQVLTLTGPDRVVLDFPTPP